jgi:hypothetical protein
VKTSLGVAAVGAAGAALWLMSNKRRKNVADRIGWRS